MTRTRNMRPPRGVYLPHALTRAEGRYLQRNWANPLPPKYLGHLWWAGLLEQHLAAVARSAHRGARLQ